MKTVSKREFTETLLANGFTERDYNSCNAWGEGSEGVQYVHPVVSILVAKAYCRAAHFNTDFVTTTFSVKHNGKLGRVGDSVQSPKLFAGLLKALRADGIVK